MGDFTAAAVVQKYFVGFHIISQLSVVSCLLSVDRLDVFDRFVRYDGFDGLVRLEIQGLRLRPSGFLLRSVFCFEL